MERTGRSEIDFRSFMNPDLELVRQVCSQYKLSLSCGGKQGGIYFVDLGNCALLAYDPVDSSIGVVGETFGATLGQRGRESSLKTIKHMLGLALVNVVFGPYADKSNGQAKLLLETLLSEK